MARAVRSRTARQTSWTRVLLLAAAIVVGVWSPGSLCAQSVWLQGGTSTLMSASGAQLNYRWSPVQGWFGIGSSHGIDVGGFLGTQYHHYDIGLGDRYQSLALQSDLFDPGRYFAGRGAFVTRNGENQSWTAFAGATADEHSYNFFRAFDVQQSTAAFFYSRKFSRATYSSFTLAQDKMTSIHSVQYALSSAFKISAAAGVGYGSRYLSAGAKYEFNRFQVVAGYTSVGDSFQRIGGVTTNAPEHIGSNIRVRYQPIRRLGVSLAHENLFSPVLRKEDQPMRVSLDSGSVFTSAKGFNINATLTKSTSGPLETRTTNIGVSRDITRIISASGSYMRMGMNTGISNIYIGQVREKISPRLSLNQGISKQGGMNSVTFGGQFRSNRLTIGVQHDMVYSTLAGGFGGSPYVHMWTVNLHAHLFRGISIHGDSIVDPTGKVHYTAWADGIGFSKDHEQYSSGPTQPSASFSKYVVKGVVQDTEGRPVWGISVQVDGQNAFSDNAGRFFLRFRRGDTYPVSIIPERSLNTIDYEVAQAPVSATAQPEDVAQTIIIVVRRSKVPVRRRSELDDTQPTLPASPHAAGSERVGGGGDR